MSFETLLDQRRIILLQAEGRSWTSNKTLNCHGRHSGYTEPIQHHAECFISQPMPPSSPLLATLFQALYDWVHL